MYAKCFKRVIDFLLSLIALSVLSPVLLILIIVGAIAMKGNPFFTQRRPGRREKIFRLIKFRTMTNARDKDGNLLPDDQRLCGYGKFLRSTSLDELPELFNILVGHMSIVGPRPLLVEYLPWYTETERLRHSVRPGLTGWAQVNGRNSVDWDRRFALDVEYVQNLTFRMDVKILFLTVKSVLSRSDVAEDTRVAEGNFADIRRAGTQTAEAPETVTK
jgi:lipopolysaccharide/colanic/teichoic acid biosynthesis glycosyltransferase